jgi:sortase A
MKKLKKLIFPLLVFFVAVSISLFSYPTISNFINEINNESTYEVYSNNINTFTNEKLQSILNQAEKYNEIISSNYFDEENTAEYNQILNSYNDILDFEDDLMCYIEIPKINVKLPVYHGESEDVLKKGAAHLQNTSLPIGGENTHAAISAHSGYPAQKFFDDLDELEKGDIFYINILNQKLKYEVYNIEVVEPNDSKALEVIEGKDIVTLITCYPYGINTHRLLVHAQRVYESTSEDITKNELDNIDSINYIPLIIIITVIIFAVIILIIIKKKIINKL